MNNLRLTTKLTGNFNKNYISLFLIIMFLSLTMPAIAQSNSLVHDNKHELYLYTGISYLFPIKSNSLSISSTSNILSDIYNASYSNISEDLSEIFGFGYCYNFPHRLGLGINLSYRPNYTIKEQGVLYQENLYKSEACQTIFFGQYQLSSKIRNIVFSFDINYNFLKKKDRNGSFFKVGLMSGLTINRVNSEIKNASLRMNIYSLTTTDSYNLNNGSYSSTNQKSSSPFYCLYLKKGIKLKNRILQIGIRYSSLGEVVLIKNETDPVFLNLVVTESKANLENRLTIESTNSTVKLSSIELTIGINLIKDRI